MGKVTLNCPEPSCLPSRPVLAARLMDCVQSRRCASFSQCSLSGLRQRQMALSQVREPRASAVAENSDPASLGPTQCLSLAGLRAGSTQQSFQPSFPEPVTSGQVSARLPAWVNY